MKRKITKIASALLGGMLLACAVLGSYAEMSDGDVLADSFSPAAEEGIVETEAITDEEEQKDDKATGKTVAEPPAATDEEPQEEAANEPVAESQEETADEAAAELPAAPDKEPQEESEDAEDADAAGQEPAGEIPEAQNKTDEENEPEPDENSDDVTDDEGQDEYNVTEEELIEFEDDDYGYLEPSAIPEKLQTVTPEMKFEGITELCIGSEVSGVANEEPASYHYIRSGSARIVDLTLYANEDIRVQINDKPVELEPDTDANGKDCMVCTVSLRSGETFISLSAQSVSYSLRADAPDADEETDGAIPEETVKETIKETAVETDTPAEAKEEQPAPSEEAPAGTEIAAAPDEPAAELPVITGENWAENQDPNRYVIVHSSIDGQKRVYRNTYVKMTAEPVGYEGTDYRVQWYYSPDGGATQIPIPGADKLTYVYQVNDENFHYIWSAKVTPVDG